MSQSVAAASQTVNLNLDHAVSPQQKPVQPITTTTTGSSSLEKVVSACTGAVITMSFMNPLDVVKTRLQETSKNGAPQYKGTMDGLSKILKNEGVFALWRGLVPGLAMALPSTAIYFVGYDYIRDHTKLHFANTALDTYSPLWAGGAARTMSALVVSPMELFRTRMQSAEGANGFQGVWDGVRRMVQKEGPKALWRGLIPTMLRDVPFSAVYWMGYEKIKHRLQKRQDMSHFQIAFLSGAGSGMIAAVFTTPFDVVKTQRQVSSDAEEARLGRILKNIMVKDGAAGFFRGVTPRVVKVAPACAIMISSYEMGKRFFADRKTEQLQQKQ